MKMLMFLFFSLVSMRVCGESITDTDFKPDDFGFVSVKNESVVIKIGAKYEDVQSVLGEPVEVEVIRKYPDKDDDWDTIRYHYDGLIITRFRCIGSIKYISVDKNLFKTTKGITIGDKREDVIAKYGEPNEFTSKAYLKYSYFDKEQGIYIIFEIIIRKGVVAKISVLPDLI